MSKGKGRANRPSRQKGNKTDSGKMFKVGKKIRRAERRAAADRRIEVDELARMTT